MEKQCAQCNNSFIITAEDEIFYKKFEVPHPQSCPQCRLIRRLMERNSRNLYYRSCNATAAKTLSQYHADQPFPVYSPAAWWSEDFDATHYGRDFDFSRDFFEQFAELKRSVPHLALFNTEGTMENSDYNNCTAYLKNCYLIAESDYCQDCYYSNLLKKCTDLMDCSVCYEDELCYECIDCQGCYNLRYSQDCQQCRDSAFLKNCISCKDCIGCINQRQKQYMIFNVQYSQQEYQKIKKELRLDDAQAVEECRRRTDAFFVTQPHKALIGEHNLNSLGDHLFNSKNAYCCFDSKDLEDCRYCAKLSLGIKNSMDYNSWGNQSELMYQCVGAGDHCYNCRFCVMCHTNVINCDYCYECFSCSDCFACVGLKKKRYCILNKQYSKEAFDMLRLSIIEHMKKTSEFGQFFPVGAAAFAYNESIAMDIFPLTQDEALRQGYKWRQEPASQSSSAPAEAVPCSCGRYFKIIPQEKAFYSKMQLPQPAKCPGCRHKNRISKRNSLALWKRNCRLCRAEIQSSYDPSRPEIIYCEECFLKEIY